MAVRLSRFKDLIRPGILEGFESRLRTLGATVFGYDPRSGKERRMGVSDRRVEQEPYVHQSRRKRGYYEGRDRRSGKDRRKVDSAAYEIGMFRDRRKAAEVPLRERIAQALAKNGVPHYFNVADALIKELGL